METRIARTDPFREGEPFITLRPDGTIRMPVAE
jgi:hypothetical protein